MDNIPPARAIFPIGQIVVVFAGLGLLALVWLANRQWFDRHFLPNFFITRERQLMIATTMRALAALLGAAFVLAGAVGVARHGLISRRTVSAATILTAICASALVTTELILRTRTWRVAQFHNRQEPRRVEDAYLGWTFQPNHHGYKGVAGRRIGFAIDGHGYRVSSPTQQVDYMRPSVIFSGESVMAGDGLPWNETIPAQVAKRIQLQPAILAVNGYSTDQSYMRLASDLHRFACPVAVVSIFMPSFLDRNLNVDRPHLDRDLRWRAARPGWRLAALANDVLHYRGSEEIELGIGMTRAALSASKVLAQKRSAAFLLVVPQFTPEPSVEAVIRKRVLDDGGLDYVLVPVDSHLRIPGDRHPDARGAAVIAAAIANRLESTGVNGATRVGPGNRQCRDSSQ